MKRTLAALPVVILAATMLVGCSTTDAASGCEPVAPGSASKAVKLEGKFGEQLKLTSKTPIDSVDLQRSVAIEGEGEQLTDTDMVKAHMSMFTGSDGTQVASEDALLSLDEQSMAPWVIQSLKCSSEGDRVVTTAPAATIFPQGGQDFGVEASDSVLVVLDLKQIVEPRAVGEEQELPEGFPEVSLGKDGDPTITIPEGVTPSGKPEIATRIKGDGPVVKAGDNVSVQYRGVIWRTGETFDSSWDRGSIAPFNTNGVIGGFSDALVGQTVGSQVVSIVPAGEAQGGYPEDKLVEMGHQKDDTMVFVLDIVDASTPPKQ
ncbi:FKBP-type peptidyl-prolyl cis-trans isomerase [Leucobacter sp. M11]|uniref:FKBP-type peptidyl-prolyl cis-trans isomerase n=1 Tax=Leucobacter sp. M11 TaxID=2993565 RepID=UPI002D806287|nr:FKBP-type peptidyl-prolyl cis-trans isomerase [Leucobacter sp. M11]MEB4615526.1 FKBP-type peptidyl-prolyl cis-trans isomerase [Leucobacter sp. M11]